MSPPTSRSNDHYLIDGAGSPTPDFGKPSKLRMDVSAPLQQHTMLFSRAIAVGYAYSERPVSIADLRTPLAIRIKEAERVHVGTSKNATELSNHDSRLPGTWSERTEGDHAIDLLVEPWPVRKVECDSDVSGILGLRSSWGIPNAERQHSAFERTVADAQTWALHEAIKRANTYQGDCVILLQGPLLPKLRGRLYYRLLDPVRTPIFVVTSNPTWAHRLVKRVRKHVSRTKQPTWVGPFPDPTIDSGTRCFVLHSYSGLVHVSVPANMLPSGQAKNYWEKCKWKLANLFESGVTPCGEHAQVDLPEPLSSAIAEATAATEPISLRELAAAFMSEYHADPASKHLPPEQFKLVTKLLGAAPDSMAATWRPVADEHCASMEKRICDPRYAKILQKLGLHLRGEA